MKTASDGMIEELMRRTRGRITMRDIIRTGAREMYVVVLEKDLENLTDSLEGTMELVSLYCAEGFGNHKGLTLFYAFTRKGAENMYMFVMPLRSAKALSISKTFPSASWYEREITDGFGVDFVGAFDKRRLFLHEAYPEGFHPLRKDFHGSLPETSKGKPEETYEFRRMDGEGVYEIPVGPVHAGIIEPGHFRFSVIGEPVHNLEVRMFYKHRGIEKLAEGLSPEKCVRFAESISGDETIANSVCFCSAVEEICGIKLPERALYLRTLLMELERMYSHLGDLAGMCVDVAFPVGASAFLALREEILRTNMELTGSRFMKGAIALGGLSKDLQGLGTVPGFLRSFRERFTDALEYVKCKDSVIDRFETTGIVKNELIEPLHITGPIARASGSRQDARTDHPYLVYPRLRIDIKTVEAGDVLSRFDVKAREVMESTALIKKIIKDLPSGKVRGTVRIKDGYSSFLVESPRGETFHWVCIKDGLVDRFKVRTASFCNWQAIEHAVIGNIVPDFPLINKSFNLSYAGTDV